MEEADAIDAHLWGDSALTAAPPQPTASPTHDGSGSGGEGQPHPHQHQHHRRRTTATTGLAALQQQQQALLAARQDIMEVTLVFPVRDCAK